MNESSAVPKEAKPVMEEGYLEGENLRRSLAVLRDAQNKAHILLGRRSRYLEEWVGGILPEPPEIPLQLLADSMKDIEESLNAVESKEVDVKQLFGRYRFPAGRPVPALALGLYGDGRITIYEPVLAKVAQLFSLSYDRLRHLALVYFLAQAILHLGYDGDQRMWDNYQQAEPALTDGLANYYAYNYASKYDVTLLEAFQLWQQYRQEGNSEWTDMCNFGREQVRSALVLIRQEQQPTWLSFTDLLDSIATLR